MAVLHKVISGNSNVVVSQFLHNQDVEHEKAATNLIKEFTDAREIPLIVLESQLCKGASELKMREARYDGLYNLCKEVGSRLIVTGHHADDQVETILFRLFRGTVSGLRGMREFTPYREDVFIYRPLLKIRKDEILQYLNENKVPFLLDPDNSDLNFSRNQIRHLILPEIEKNFEHAVKNILNTCEILSQEDDVLEKVADDFLKKNLNEGGDIPTNSLKSLSSPKFRRVVRRWFKDVSGLPLDSKALDRASKAVANHTQQDMRNGFRFVVDKKRARIIQSHGIHR